MKRYIVAFLFALLLCFTLPIRLNCYAVQSSTTDGAFQNLTIASTNTILDELNTNSYKYFVLLCQPDNGYTSSEYAFSFRLYCLNNSLSDNDNFYYSSNSAGADKFPYRASFYIGDDQIMYTGKVILTNSQYERTFSNLSFSQIYRIEASGMTDTKSNVLSMDNYNRGMFPFFPDGEPVAYKPASVVFASNCDIYDFQGHLLQAGSYDRLIDICPWLANYCENLSTYEPPTEPPTYSGYEQEQASNSRTIIGKLSDVWNSISALPSAIAQNIGGFFDSLGDRISGFFDSLLDGIISGLQYLFVPSDNNFDDLITLIRSKFGFITQIIELSDFLLTTDFSQQKPTFTITIPSVGDVTTFNDMLYYVYDRWRSLAHNIMIACMVYLAYRKLKHRAVDVINGESPKEG